MKTIKLLDCTLRDGGYINDWRFGKENINSTVHILETSNIDILEVGFLRDEPSDEDRTIFRSVEEIGELIPRKRENVIYSVMVEVFRPIPIELVSLRNDKTIDMIRVIVWKDKHDKEGKLVDALLEGYEYCKGFADKGYDLCVQPARVEQYSDEEFVNMLKLYCTLKPKAIYIVDSWGTMYPEDVIHYLELADQALPQDIGIGFHGHNNMMQAFSNAVDFIRYETDRELILDASVYGMGRGAGNLNTEIIAKYLNEIHGKAYDIGSFLEIYEKTVKDLKKKYAWGYSPAYFMTAYHHSNPQYGTWYESKDDVKSTEIDAILNAASDEDKVMYEDSKAKRFLDEHRKKGS